MHYGEERLLPPLPHFYIIHQAYVLERCAIGDDSSVGNRGPWKKCIPSEEISLEPISLKWRRVWRHRGNMLWFGKGLVSVFYYQQSAKSKRVYSFFNLHISTRPSGCLPTLIIYLHSGSYDVIDPYYFIQVLPKMAVLPASTTKFTKIRSSPHCC